MRSFILPNSARRSLASAAIGVALLATPLAARADVAPPPSCDAAKTDPCAGKGDDDACTLAGGANGTCKPLFCATASGETARECVATGEPATPNDDSGCAVEGAGRGRGAPLAAFGVGFGVLLGLARRRRAFR